MSGLRHQTLPSDTKDFNAQDDDERNDDFALFNNCISKVKGI